MLYNFDELSFQILTVYRFQHKDGTFYANARPYAAISFRLRGESEFKICGKRLHASEGDVSFIPANTPYELKSLGSDIIVMHLSDCNYHEPEVFHPQNPGLFKLLFLHLLDSWNALHSVNGTKSIIYDILEKMDGEERSAAAGTSIDACLSYIEAHFCESSLRIADVCGVGFMSQSALQRAFHARFGMSPKAYLNRLRMNRALDLLAMGEHSVQETALASGFSDEKFFSRAFKKKFGFSPSKLQRSIL